MVEIIPNSMTPYVGALFPAIKFTVKESVSENILVLGVRGTVLTEDDKYISDLKQTSTQSQQQLRVRRLSDYNRLESSEPQFELAFALDKKALDYVEDVRQRNRKRDVVFKFAMESTRLIHDLRVGEYQLPIQNPGLPQKAQPILSSVGQPDTGNINLNILVTGMNQSQLLRLESSKQTLTYEVKSSDWVNDFQKPLGIGNFLVVEIPETTLESVGELKLLPEQAKFEERLEKAYEILPKMELYLRQGEWGRVVAESRGLLELFTKDETRFVKSMISQTTTVDDDKAGAITQAFDNLSSYANELHHVVGRQGQVKDVYTGGKEDAYLVYMVSASLVNLLARKFKTMVQPSH